MRNDNIFIIISLSVLLVILFSFQIPDSSVGRFQNKITLPIRSNYIQLTNIGTFGLTRKARPKIPEHLHTGIDIKRPRDNYVDEPIHSIADGVVISKRQDGPYAQLIIEHQSNELTFWTVYEHIAEIKVQLNDDVKPEQEIARFFNKEELNKYGWQFDHFHFEILKERPLKITPPQHTPNRHFKSYTLQCFTTEDLSRFFFNPLLFFKNR